jgi:hypothetical protein
MTPHLSADDQIAALEGALSAEARAHVAGCDACRDSVARMSAVVGALRADEVPEPSPLFWDHLSARVREGTAADPVVASSRFGWRVWVTVASAALAFAAVFVVQHTPDRQAPPNEPTAIASAPAAPADAPDAPPLAAVMQMASTLSSDDLTGVVSSTDDGTPLVEDLSPAERDAFVRLLHAEMEKVQ